MNGDSSYIDKQILATDISVAVRGSLRGYAKNAEHRILSILNDEIVEFTETTNKRIEAIMKMVEKEKKGEQT